MRKANGRPTQIYVGTAGWCVPNLHAGLFPPIGTHLQRYARVFNCVEINTCFYRPHLLKSYIRWGASVPSSFRFSVKMPKAITHERRLRGCRELIRAFLDETNGLKSKREFILIQLPPSLEFNQKIALPFFDQLRDLYAGRIALEARHPSWWGPRASLLKGTHHIVEVEADPAVHPVTAELGINRARYLRLHGSPRMYYSAYSEERLQKLAHSILKPDSGLSSVWCIFDNTAAGHAVFDAYRARLMVSNGGRSAAQK